MRRTLAALILVGLFAPLAAPSVVGAQDCEAEPTPRAEVRRVARRHFREGVAASQASQWEAARESFQRAHDAAPFTPIVYNLASSLEQTGRLIEAAEMFQIVLRRCEASRDLRADAQELLQGLERRLATVTLRIAGYDAERDQILLDDAPLTGAVLGEPLPVNPGQHAVRVTRGDEGDVATGNFRVEEGGAWTLELSIGGAGASDGGEDTRVADGGAGGETDGTPGAAGGFDAAPAWGIFGASLAVAAAGGVLLGLGQADASAVESSPPGTPWVDVADQAERADLFRNIGWVALGIGVAGAAVGLGWALAGGGGDGSAATLRLGPGGLAVDGRF